LRGVEANGDVTSAEDEPLVETTDAVERFAPNRQARTSDGQHVAIPVSRAHQGIGAGLHALKDMVGESAHAEDHARVLDLAVGTGELQSGDANLRPHRPADDLS
jgi:hypothetical protein